MYILQTESPAGADPNLRRIVAAYDDIIVRAYCTVRFTILRQRFLSEIGQFLPPSGLVLDVGCGFGLFALYFALRNPRIRVRGLDLNERRIAMARKAAERLGLENAEFHIGNAASFRFNEAIAGAYMLDLVHHIPEASVPALLETIASNLLPGARLLVKDIDPTGRYKRAFTWVLDKAMDYKAPVNYWHPDRLQRLLEGLGFEVRRHQMIDYLPYPHILYVNQKVERAS
jgi:SAM-dependent methyltransferase